MIFAAVRLEFIHGQVTPYTSKVNSIISHPANKILRVWWSLALQRT